MAPRYAKTYIGEFLRILNPEGILTFDLPSHSKGLFLFKHKIANIVPYSLLQTLFKAVLHRPAMYMYPIKKQELFNYLEGKARIIGAEECPEWKEWFVYRYYIAK
jgi:hypothetical protein